MTAYEGRPLSTPVDAAVLVLLPAAREGRLVVCAGAGLSMADDAALPSGKRLGELLDERLRARLAGYTSPADIGDLLAVADAAVVAAGGLLPLQHEVLQIADFDQAPPNYSHRTLALLLVEGAVANLLLWNWDDCVERAALEGEPLQVARTLEDIQQLHVPSVAKIHGCATRTPTLLITTQQLAEPPLWTDAAFTAQLRNATGVFIGIGDVADYAKRRLEALRRDIPELDVYVVSPSIVDGWDDSAWASIIPDLDMSRRLGRKSDEFLDELARVWALELVEGVERVIGALGDVARRGVNEVLSKLRESSAADVITWMRTGAFRRRAGHSVVRSPAAHEAVIALGMLAREQAVAVVPDARCVIGSRPLEILLACETVTATQVRAQARRRAERLAGRGVIEGDATFLVAGSVVGPLTEPEPDDILEGAIGVDDVFAGPRGVRLTFVRASDVLGAAP